MRRSLPALLCSAFLATACSSLPSYASLGEQESYCASHEDCDPGLFCVNVDGDSFCTSACSSDLDCGEGYTCGRPEGICRPARDGVCRFEQQRCGPSFEECCEGSVCAQFVPFGAFCTAVCSDDYVCVPGCCRAAGDVRICVPPSAC